jgi:molecular chaperone DnaJ
VIQEQQALTVNVPIGAEEGMVLRVPGHGVPSEQKGGVPGDLLVVLRSAADPRFERHGADLWRREEITAAEAVLGAERTVPSLDGPLELKVPAGTQPDLVLRLAGKGLPRFGGGRRGDLYVRVDVRIPERLSERARKLYEELRVEERKPGAGRESPEGVREEATAPLDERQSTV